MSPSHLIHSARGAFVASVLIFTLGVCTYFAFEPSIGRTATDEFTITQVITSEVSFIANASNVTLLPQIAGITGGTSAGTTTVRVATSDSGGYNMTIAFASTTANPGIAMNGNTQGGYIGNYTPATPGVPDFAFSVGANSAEFAYTVSASTTADLDTSFRNSSSACNDAGGVGEVAFSCWMNPTTSPSFAETIVNRGTETSSSGATTSIAFRLQVTSNPSPSVPEDTYVATATLTASVN